MKFSLKKIALITEIMGGLALFISLIFVGVQFKENTIATKSATANAANAITVSWYTTTGNSEQSSQLLWDYIKNPKSMTTDAEKFQATILMHGLILSFQNNFYLANEGTLDQNIQESLTTSIGSIKNQPGWQEYWKNRESHFFEEFRDYMNSILTSDSGVDEGIYDTLKINSP
mgnify:FL=1|tara:strand:+ start:100 stop:618 length:519 start_codon:yes stop_codon:yes gene_type:complete